MKITESTMALAAQRSYSEQQFSRLDIRVEQRSAHAANRPEVSLSDAGLAQSAQSSGAIDTESAVENDPQLRMIKQMIELILGREIELFSGRLQNPEETAAASAQNNSVAMQEIEGGFALDYREVYEESEAMVFKAAGIIRTADGREIEFSTELSMMRSYREESSLSIATGSLAQKKDPLIINYAASAATLSASTFSFDIDTDGQQDTISLLKRGSAFLALDLNGDGKVNHGRELFGTQNGDGFADLAKHDGDNNGWIDENDVVFAKLKLWIKDDSGTDKLVDLKSMGIGAIYLGNAKGDFSLNTQENRELGQIRATGIYLMEDGRAGTVQQVDLVA